MSDQHVMHIDLIELGMGHPNIEPAFLEAIRQWPRDKAIDERAYGDPQAFACWLEREHPEWKLTPAQRTVAEVFSALLSRRRSGKTFLLKLLSEWEQTQ